MGRRPVRTMLIAARSAFKSHTLGFPHDYVSRFHECSHWIHGSLNKCPGRDSTGSCPCIGICQTLKNLKFPDILQMPPGPQLWGHCGSNGYIAQSGYRQCSTGPNLHVATAKTSESNDPNECWDNVYLSRNWDCCTSIESIESIDECQVSSCFLPGWHWGSRAEETVLHLDTGQTFCVFYSTLDWGFIAVSAFGAWW